MHTTKWIPRSIALALILFFAAACGAPATITQAAVTPVSPAVTPVRATLSPAVTEPASPAGPVLLIFDDDGSRDGMAALLYLLGRPGISVQAITISYGEAHPQIYVQHVGRALAELGIQDIPLGAGQDAPLGGGTPFPDWLRQLSDDFWDYPVPNAGKTYPVQDAPQLMISTINQASGPVTLFLSGAFTNLAQALRLDEAIKDRIAAVYFMGGAVSVPGNITNLIPESSNRVAEWNIYADPQAAKEVFESGLDLYMIPLDATNPVKLNQEEIRPWHQGDEKARLAASLYDIMFNDYGMQQVEIFDLTAAVLMIRPELCSFQPLVLQVITDQGDTLGQTAVVAAGEPNIKACLQPDVEGIKQELEDSFVPAGGSLEIPSIDPIAGTWTGLVENNGFEMQISITIEETCQSGQVCGRFDISSVGCSGTLTWVGMDGELYEFQAGDKTEACGEGRDYLSPQKDGTIEYISRGDYGETRGMLHKMP